MSLPCSFPSRLNLMSILPSDCILSPLEVQGTIPEGRRKEDVDVVVEMMQDLCPAAHTSTPKSSRTCVWYDPLFEDMFIEIVEAGSIMVSCYM